MSALVDEIKMICVHVKTIQLKYIHMVTFIQVLYFSKIIYSFFTVELILLYNGE